PERRGEQRREDQDHREQRPVGHVNARRLTRRVHQQHDREYDQRAEERLDRASRDLLDRQHADRHRGQRPVLDRALPGELHDQRERHRHNALHEQHGGHQAGHQDGGEVDAARRGGTGAGRRGTAAEVEAAADLREHVGEDEDEQQRLHDRTGKGGDGVAPQHPELPRHHGVERPEQRGPRRGRLVDQGRDLCWPGGTIPRNPLLPGGPIPPDPPCDGGHSRYSRPVRVRKTVSRLGLSWVASSTLSPAAEPAVTSSPSTPSGSRVKTRTWSPSASTLLTPVRRPRPACSAMPSGTGSSYRTVMTVSAPVPALSSFTVPEASTSPWSTTETCSHSASASSM